MSNLKSWSPKKYEVKGPNMHNPNQFMASQNLLYNFLNEFLMGFFLQHLLYLRLISKSPQHYKKSKLQWTPLHKILNRKIIINHFQNWIFDATVKLKKLEVIPRTILVLCSIAGLMLLQPISPLQTYSE